MKEQEEREEPKMMDEELKTAITNLQEQSDFLEKLLEPDPEIKAKRTAGKTPVVKRIERRETKTPIKPKLLTLEERLDGLMGMKDEDFLKEIETIKSQIRNEKNDALIAKEWETRRLTLKNLKESVDQQYSGMLRVGLEKSFSNFNADTLLEKEAVEKMAREGREASRKRIDGKSMEEINDDVMLNMVAAIDQQRQQEMDRLEAERCLILSKTTAHAKKKEEKSVEHKRLWEDKVKELNQKTATSARKLEQVKQMAKKPETLDLPELESLKKIFEEGLKEADYRKIDMAEEYLPIVEVEAATEIQDQEKTSKEVQQKINAAMEQKDAPVKLEIQVQDWMELIQTVKALQKEVETLKKGYRPGQWMEDVD